MTVAAVVFDSSAVLAFIRRERGFEGVIPFLGEASMSAVNLQEVVKVLLLSGLRIDRIEEMIAELRLDLRVHDEQDAFAAARLVHQTRKFGSGLGDRSCMALAIRLGVPVLTCDRAWAELDIPGLEVRLVR